MIILFFFIYLSLTIFLTITVLNALTGPFLRKPIPLSDTPRVSLLIPARNESHNIRDCIDSLRKLNYPNLEILVLNDQSEDDTSRIVQEISGTGTRIQLYEGQALPPGWIGKNWACHQLSEIAAGEFLIFTDADNRYEPRAVENTLGWMHRYQLGVFSAFPQQLAGTFFEKLVVPVIDLFLYASLPLWLTFRASRSSLAAANGQWIAFRRESYQQIGGHSSVRDQIVEDVELSRRAKKQKIRLLTAAGTGIVYGRMYHSVREVWDGFSKILFGLVSNYTLLFFALLLGMLLVYIFPYILLFRPQVFYLALGAVGLNMLLRFILAVTYKHPVFISVFLHPLSILLIILIGFNSFFRTKYGSIFWKNREIRPKNKSHFSKK